MLGVGMASGAMSQDRRGQLFRLGGWVTLAIGILTLLRTDEMVDYTGHAALFCLIFALIARPISRFWVQPLRYRRALGVGAFVLAIAHTLHMLDHTLSWNLEALSFMLPLHQAALWFGAVALFCLLPAALTSTDGMVQRLGKGWRYLHLLAVPALLLAALHAMLIGSSYLGNLEWNATQRLRVLLLGVAVLLVLLVRSRPVWALLSLEKYYAAPITPK